MIAKDFFENHGDFLFAEKIQIPCRVGTSTEERAFPQVIHLSLKLFLPLERAGRTDALTDTVDYAETIEEIKDELSRNEYSLIESVATAAAKIALKNREVLKVEVTASKKILPGIKSVGVSISRTRQSFQ